MVFDENARLVNLVGYPFLVFYKYKLKYPHAGAGKRVQF